MNIMKTVEEAAKEYAGIKTKVEIEVDSRIKEYDAFKAGVEFAQRWIPIEEELPEERVLVLCINPFSPFVASYHGKEKGFRIPNVEENYSVTHWRPVD
jgi:hypothetical protein